MIPSPFESERLRLRTFELDDLQTLHAYLNQPDLAGRRYIPWRFPADLPLSTGQVDALIKHWAEGQRQVHLAITLKDDGTLIGHANCNWHWDTLCPDIELVIAPAYQQSGFGTEALHFLLDYLFGFTPAHSISSGMASWDQIAFDFAIKNGFKHSGSMRRVGLRNGKYFDWHGVDILRPDWLAGSKKEVRDGIRRESNHFERGAA